MTLSFHKFLLSETSNEFHPSVIDIRCSVCGVSEHVTEPRLNDLVEWAEQHECPGLRVT